MADNHTPLDHSKLQKDHATPAPVKPKMMSVSPEAAPIPVPEQKPAEAAPMAENLPLEEAKEHKIQDDSVQQYVEEKQENIELPPELQSMGLTAVTQTSFPNYQNVKLPISDEKVLVGEKAPINSSIRWLAEFSKFLLWKAHITLKTVHGRVVRVLQKKSSFK